MIISPRARDEEVVVFDCGGGMTNGVCRRATFIYHIYAMIRRLYNCCANTADKLFCNDHNLMPLWDPNV